jgi:Phosphoglycerol transferase and related proteins, alkaline phosphatase superfamily
MDTKLSITHSYTKNISILKKILLSLLEDKIILVIFLSIFIQTILFMDIIPTGGAASLNFNFLELIFGNTYLYFLFSMMLISFAFVFSKKLRIFFVSAINLLYSILLVADLWYYRGFQDFLSLHSLGETQNLNNLSKAVLSMARPIDILFVLDNIIVITLIFFLKRNNIIKQRRPLIFSILFFIPITILFAMHLVYDFKDDNYSGPVLFKTQYLPYSTMRNLSPLGFHFYDSLIFIKDNMPYKLSSAEKNKIDQWIAYKNEDLPDNSYSSMFKGKNLIFIQVESLENFVINQKISGEALTPNLNNMLNNSLYFSNFYEQVNNGNSSDADLMANASVLPTRRGSAFFRFPKNQYNTMAKLLASENYYSRSLHASDGNIWNVSTALKTFGFNESWDMNDFDQSDLSWMGLSDQSFFNQVASLTQKDSSPFFYYTVTVSSHEPFIIDDKLKTLKLENSFNNTSMGNYLQAIHYTDEQIGNFIKELDSKGILDNTLVVLYGDHCGVHKYFNDEVNALSEHETWWDDNTKVPFIIYNKNLKGQEFKTVGGEIDILPTVAYLMGINKSQYENTSLGRNLLNTNKSYAILNDGTIINEAALSQEDINHIKQSFSISDLILRTDYFNSNKK